MREFMNLFETIDETDTESDLWTLGDWLNGDVMSLVNDEGERFSPKPYYDAIKRIGALVPPTRRAALTGTLYRGVGFDDEQMLEPGRIKTALKQYQSWSPDINVAKEFARNYGGRYGVVFSADVVANKRAIVLCIVDVLAWLKTTPDGISPQCLQQQLYQFSRYEYQDEVIIRGSQVRVSGIKVVKKPRTPRS